jgi:hypothetical protein
MANAKNETHEPSLVISVPLVAREYGFDARILIEAIREGRLRASRLTARKIQVFLNDIEHPPHRGATGESAAVSRSYPAVVGGCRGVVSARADKLLRAGNTRPGNRRIDNDS